MAKKKIVPLMYPVEVYDQTRTYVTRERNKESDWDRDDIANETSVKGVGPGRTDWFTEITTPFPLERGNEYYLVYVTYRTGDSFHREDGRVRYIDLFISREKAEACAQEIEKHYRLTDKGAGWGKEADVKKLRPKGFCEWQVSYLNEAGTEITTSVSWAGYFERLNGVTIERVIARYNQTDEVPEDAGFIRYRY